MPMETGGTSETYQVLEDCFASYIGTKYAVAVNSGTSALTLALAALGVGPGDEVIVPEFTMIATAWAVSYLGAKPVFADCEDNLNVSLNTIRPLVNEKTKAIIVTHVYGRPCDVEAIQASLKIPVIEDACEAHGAEIRNKKVGSLGIMGCFSFYKNKIVAAEEGGIVTTDNEGLYERMKSLKNMAFGDENPYLHKELGFNFRMPNSQASRVLMGLAHIKTELRLRNMKRDMFDEYLERFTLPRPEGSVMWVYDMVFRQPYIRDSLLKQFPGITRPFFVPMSQQPMYFNKNYKKLRAYYFSTRGLYFKLDMPWMEAGLQAIKIKKLMDKIHTSGWKRKNK